jgi:hypothetical protein
MFLHQDIDHISILIHSPPEIVALPLDGHEQLVQVPDVSQLSLPTPEFPSVVWSELLRPLLDGFGGDHHASLGQELLDVSDAQREPVV